MNLFSFALRPPALRKDQSSHSVQHLVAEVREGPNQDTLDWTLEIADLCLQSPTRFCSSSSILASLSLSHLAFVASHPY